MIFPISDIQSSRPEESSVPQSTRAPKIPIAKPLKPHRIVVMEDNLDQVHSFAMLLRDMGHSVDYAINGDVGLEVIRRFRPDTVILDLGLPGIDGVDVCRQIKADPEFADRRVIAHTAYGDEEHWKKAAEVGFSGTYTKPLDPQTLYERFV